jgi:hypothetical protein
LAVAAGMSDSVALAPPLFTVAGGDLRQLMRGFFFGGKGTVSPLLEPSPHLVELIKGMETVIALLENKSVPFSAVPFSAVPSTSKYLVVVYHKLNRNGGFILTAYFTGRPSSNRVTLWN